MPNLNYLSIERKLWEMNIKTSPSVPLLLNWITIHTIILDFRDHDGKNRAELFWKSFHENQCNSSIFIRYILNRESFLKLLVLENKICQKRKVALIYKNFVLIETI